MAKNDGGPAFPALGADKSAQVGMSLRDYFAGQVIVGFLARETGAKHRNYDELSIEAYDLADHLINQRDK